ncbi:hypothetical protein CLV51_1023 [Chitinophaga niastensis]|uniref:Uncharacterized protein n=1 Tax=Chitinophaga niastensis TaxID=536980 RepID=A0A2P8HLR3_CHINA|nr:hypothetical protein [Chitinophaga niastensis]PSL47158.1 hypothetical protein CLV51_1023 [Chitinophaga niastensis]
MKHHFYTGLLLLTTAAISSCNKHIYVPNTVNAPLLKEKYEFKGSISPTNLQTAFALTDNIAIMANGQYVYGFNYTDTKNNNDLFIDHQTRGGVIEGAIGFFKPLDVKKRMVFDVYAGYGGGSFKTLAGNYNNNPSANVNDYLLRNHFSKVFIQPGFGFVHPVFEAAFTSRFSLLNFYNSTIGIKAFENDATGQTNFMHINAKPIAFYEPAFTFRVGYKYVKFQMQLQVSVPLNDNTYSGYNINEYFQPVAFGMGASVDIAHWYDNFRKRK